MNGVPLYSVSFLLFLPPLSYPIKPHLVFLLSVSLGVTISFCYIHFFILTLVCRSLYIPQYLHLHLHINYYLSFPIFFFFYFSFLISFPISFWSSSPSGRLRFIRAIFSSSIFTYPCLFQQTYRKTHLENEILWLNFRLCARTHQHYLGGSTPTRHSQ